MRLLCPPLHLITNFSRSDCMCLCVTLWSDHFAKENPDLYLNDKFWHHVKLGNIFLLVVVFRLLLLSKSTSGMKIF